MLLCFLAFILVALVAAYYASQGLFSAMISLVAAVFASILAMGLFEALDGPIAGYKPAYARGTTFLLIFFVVLSACRLGADYLVPKNIRLKEKAVDIAAGAIPAFFAAMIIVGSILIGMEMLPLPTTLLGGDWMPTALGFDRFPGKGEDFMQGDQPGTVAAPRNVWLAPDRFTLLLWDGASGRGLGGDKPFDSIHPDLIVENYGYRNVVQYGSTATLPADLLTIGAAYYSDDPAVLERCHVPTSGDKRAAVVRIEVKPGVDAPDISQDPDRFFRISASEIRLVTDKERQYYPIGHLLNGTTFEATPLGSGHLVDDYVGGKVVEDWVFEIGKDEKPKMIEVKELARKDLVVDDAKGPKPPAAALAVAAYPKREYRKNVGTIDVIVMGAGGPLGGAKVYIMVPSTKLSVVQGTLDAASRQIIAARDQIVQGSGEWVAAQGKPGVPSDGQLNMAQRSSRDDLLQSADAQVYWNRVIPAMVIGNCKPDGDQNISGLPRYFENSVEPLLNEDQASIRGKQVTGADGKVEFKNVAPGKYTIICSGGTGDAYYLWARDITLAAKATVNEALDPSLTAFTLKK